MSTPEEADSKPPSPDLDLTAEDSKVENTEKGLDDDPVDQTDALQGPIAEEEVEDDDDAGTGEGDPTTP